MSLARANKNSTIILQRLAAKGQVVIANALNTDESTVSRLKDKTAQFSSMLSELGLKVVPEDLKCYRESYIASLEEIAKQHFSSDPKPPLEWD